MSPYITHTDQEIKDALSAAKSNYNSVIVKWTAGDTSVEKDKSRLEKIITQLVEECSRRPSLQGLVRRTPLTRTVAAFS